MALTKAAVEGGVGAVAVCVLLGSVLCFESKMEQTIL